MGFKTYLSRMEKVHWTLKEKLEVAEAVCTIIVSIMALWGTIVAVQHDLFQKATRLINHYHAEIEKLEQVTDL